MTDKLSIAPSDKNTEDQILREAVQQLLSGKHRAVTSDDLIGTGWFEWDASGTLRIGRTADGIKKQVLDQAVEISTFADAVQSLQVTFEEVVGGIRSQARDITELQTNMSLQKKKGDMIAGRIDLDAKANREMLSRITSTNGMVEVLAQEATTLQASAAVSEGMLSFLNNGVEANASATASLTARVTATEDKVEALAEDVVELQASVNVLPRVFLQPAEPDVATQGPFIVGDMWLDSDDGNKVSVWDGSAWGPSVDLVGATIYAQTEPPVSVGMRVGDMWFDTDDNNRQHRWSGITWVDVTNPVIDATASAVNSLTARVELTEQGVATHSTQITNLQTAVAGKADASAVSSLSSRVDTLDGTVTAQGTAITNLQSAVAGKADASAVNSLTTRVTDVEGVVTAQGTAITNLQSAVAGKADATAVSSLTTRVTDVEGVVTAQGQAITKVDAKLSSPWSNRLRNPSFLNGSTADWVGSAGALTTVLSPRLGAIHIAAIPGAGHRYLASLLAKDTVNNFNLANPGEVSTFAATVNCDGTWYLEFQYYNDAGVAVGITSSPTQPSTAGDWKRFSVTSNPAPAGATWFAVVLWADNTVSNHRLALPMVNLGDAALPFVDTKSPMAQAQALTTQTAKVTALEANATITNAAIAKLGGSGNLLQTTVFGLGLGLSPWFLRGAGGTWVINDTDFQNDPLRVPLGMKALVFFADSSQAAGAYVYYAQSVPVERGKKYIASMYVLPYQATTEIQVIFVNAAGNQTGPTHFSPPTSVYAPNGNLSGYTRLQVITDAAPADAVTVWINVVVSKNLAAPADAALWVLQPMLEQAVDSQTQATPWVSGANPATTASAINTLTVNINATTGKVNAANSVLLDVNNYVSGTVSENNGQRASFAIKADVFSIVAPGGGARTEFSSGNWRVYNPAGALIVQMGNWT